MVKINRLGSPIVFTNTHAGARDLRAALVFGQVSGRESRQPRMPLIASCAWGCRFEKEEAAGVSLNLYRSLFCWSHDEAHAQRGKRRARQRDHRD